MITDFEIEGQTNNDFMNIPEGIQEEIPWA